MNDHAHELTNMNDHAHELI